MLLSFAMILYRYCELRMGSCKFITMDWSILRWRLSYYYLIITACPVPLIRYGGFETGSLVTLVTYQSDTLDSFPS